MLFFGQRIEIFVGSSVLALESKCRLARSTIVDRAGRELGGGRGERERERRVIKSFFQLIVSNVTFTF